MTSSIRAQRAVRGMVVAPHALSSQAALAVLREGGNALEAMIAAAATVAVVYPHMNSIGVDSFCLMYASRFETGIVCELAERGHDVEILQQYDDAMARAGCIIRRADGVLEGGADPRSDGMLKYLIKTNTYVMQECFAAACDDFVTCIHM